MKECNRSQGTGEDEVKRMWMEGRGEEGAKRGRGEWFIGGEGEGISTVVQHSGTRALAHEKRGAQDVAITTGLRKFGRHGN